MSIDVIALLLVLPSAVILWLLANRDPKRLRVRRKHERSPLSGRQRTILSLLLFSPGLPLLGLGYWSAFLIWFGLVFMAGWCVALILSVLSR